jgi:hypothetical protein
MQTRRSTTTYTSRRSRTMSRNYNSVSYVSAVKLGPVTHTVLVALMITVLGLIYLTQATKATSYDYAASEIDNKIAELSIQKGDLEVENAKLTALETVQNSSVASAMTQPKATDYAR